MLQLEDLPLRENVLGTQLYNRLRIKMKNVSLVCFAINLGILFWAIQVGAGAFSISLSIICAGICLYSYAK